MATATPYPDSFNLNFVRQHAEIIRQSVEAAGASDPRIVGDLARGLTPRDNNLDLLVSDQPTLSLLDLVALEERLSLILDMDVSVWIEEGYRPDERARYVAQAVPL